jgi:polyhydroxybutyrate depolymerase
LTYDPPKKAVFIIIKIFLLLRTVFWGFGLTLLAALFFSGSSIYKNSKTADGSKMKRIEGSIEVNHHLRHYVLHVPEPLDSTLSLPLVFVLHGAFENPKRIEKMSNFHAQQNRGKFITVYPASEGNFWDDGRANVNPNIDDVKFINTLIDTLEKRYNINKNAIFSTGMSNGATMSVRLACESPKIKAVAMVASTAVEKIIDHCRPPAAKSAMFIKGTRDHISNFHGVQRKKQHIVGFYEAVHDFLAIDNCIDKFIKVPIPDSVDDGTSAIRKRYTDCKDDAEVVSIVVKNGGHTWPGAPNLRKKIIVGKTSYDFSASKIIWDFFKRHIH